MRGGRTRTCLGDIDQPGLDGDAPGTHSQCRAGKARRNVATPQPSTRTVARLGDFCTCLAGLAKHLIDEGIAALFGRTRTEAETVIIVAAHIAPSSKTSVAEREKHGLNSMPTRYWLTTRHGAATGRVPRSPHVQTRFSRNVVPRPFILPCIFSRPDSTGMRCPGGAAQSAACRPVNTHHATGVARSGQAVCTGECTLKRA